MNEPSTKPNFENRIDKSNLDLILASIIVLGRITHWKISEEESILDHSIITNGIRMRKNTKNTNMKEQKYRVNLKTLKCTKNLSREVEIISGSRVAKPLRTTSTLNFTKIMKVNHT